MMRLVLLAVVALTLTLALALPTGAGARTLWVCKVPVPEGGTETVVFVSAADRALHGIITANGRAGQVFLDQFGEECSVNP
jgi:hypothetical protein